VTLPVSFIQPTTALAIWVSLIVLVAAGLLEDALADEVSLADLVLDFTAEPAAGAAMPKAGRRAQRTSTEAEKCILNEFNRRCAKSIKKLELNEIERSELCIVMMV
jgi:hypothetical protein